MIETIENKPIEKILKLTAEEEAFSRVIESIVEQWGFKPLLGRVWSLLYMRNEPLNPSQIEYELALSKGNVNGLLNELIDWGVVKKVRVASDRNYYYEVEQQIWKSISNVLQSREARILDEAIERTTHLEHVLTSAGKNPHREHQIQRIKHVRETLETAQTLTSLLIKSSPDKLAKISKLVSKLRSL
jgi:DNA-binding transcriptional regulator GbsR (MarR family)